MNDLQLRLKQRLIRNEGEVLQELQSVFEHNQEAYNQVVQLEIRLRHYRNEHILGTADQLTETNRNRITEAVLTLIDTITEAEAAAYEMKQAFFQQLLIICGNEERASYLRGLFSADYFKNVSIDASGQPLSSISVKSFDLIIFDGYSPSINDDDHALLRYYLDNTTPYMLFFGAYLPLLNEAAYRERVYYTSSKFSLHARLEEMIKFLRYTE